MPGEVTLPFFILSVLTIVGAAAALTLRNLVHCVLALMLAFVGLAGLYLQLGAQFIGFAQILVYIGAVAILIVSPSFLHGIRYRLRGCLFRPPGS